MPMASLRHRIPVAVVTLSMLAVCLVPAAQAAGPTGSVPGTSSGPAPLVTSAASTNPLQLLQALSLRGGYVSAGVAMRNRGLGAITLTGIPRGSRVTAAYLFWDILANATATSFAQGTLNGHAVTGTLVGTGADPCWSNTNNFAYEADVTRLVFGNGSYALANFASGTTNGQDPWSAGSTAPMIEGASLVVVYHNDATGPTQVLIYDGAAETQADLLSQTLSGFSAPSQISSATTTFIVGDGQAAAKPGSTFNGNFLPSVASNGNDPQAGPAFSMGNLWDTETVNVAPFVKPGDTSATATLQGGPDCLVWVAQVFSVTASLIPGAPPVGTPTGVVAQAIPAQSACVDVIRTGSLPFVITGVLTFVGQGAESVPIYNVEPVGTTCNGSQAPGVQGITIGVTQYPHVAGQAVSEAVGTPSPDQLSVDLAWLGTQFAVCLSSGPSALKTACVSFILSVARLWLWPAPVS